MISNIAATSLGIMCISISGVMNGMLIGIIPKPLSKVINETFNLHYGVHIGETGISAVFSAFSTADKVGNLLGLIFILPLLDSKGRKFVAVHIGCLMTVFISLLQIFAAFLPSAEAFFLAILIGSMNVTMGQVLFLTECSPDKWRGFFGSFPSIGAHIGFVLESVLARPSIFGNDHWFVIPATSLIVTLVAYLYLLFTYDSPEWLIAHGKTEKAKKSLQFYKKNTDIDWEINKILKEIDSTPESKLTWTQCWKDDVVRPTLLVIMFVSALVDVSSMTFEAMFSVTIFGLLGVPTETILTINTMTSIFGVLLGLLGSYAIDKLGRRPMVFFAFSLLMIKNITMAFGTWVSFASGPSTMTFIIGVLNRILNSFVSSSGAPYMSSLLIAEAIPPSARVAAAQMHYFVPLILSMPVSALFPLTITVFPPTLYIFFIFLHPILAIYIFSYLFRNLPETKNRAVCNIVTDMTDNIASRRNTRISTVISEAEHLLSRKKQNVYKTMEYE